MKIFEKLKNPHKPVWVGPKAAELGSAGELSGCLCMCVFGAGVEAARLYEACPEGIQPCNMKKRHLLKKIQDTRDIVHRTMMSQSPAK